MKKIIAIEGDLVFYKINKIPTKAKKRNDKVLVYGESTGHSHRITNGDVYDYEDRVLFSIPSYAEIVHEEHKPIPFEKGEYEVIRQRQKTGKDMVALVVD